MGFPRLAGRTWIWACAGVAGFTAQPTFLGLTAWLGLAAGLEPAPLAQLAWEPGLALVALVVAPAAEEWVHRGMVYGALRRSRLGVPGAVLGSSASFALLHAEPWAVLGSFGVGLALGASRAAGGSLGFCIAVHAGLNASGLAVSWRWAAPWWLALAAVAWAEGLRRSRALAAAQQR